MTATADQILDSAYGDFAAFYDRFTADHDYDLWVAVVERLARAHGFESDELIDAACGTGKSFLPWARRGFRVRAFDRSPQMLALAAAKCEAEGLAVDLAVHDLRSPLPWPTALLVTCLDDAVNYQCEETDLDALVLGLAGLVGPGGLAVFDTNTRLTYASSYVRSSEVRHGDLVMRWEGEQLADEVFEAVITVREGERECLCSRHRQRYWPRRRIARAVRDAGLTLLDVYGMCRDASVHQPADDRGHTKFLYVVTR